MNKIKNNLENEWIYAKNKKISKWKFFVKVAYNLKSFPLNNFTPTECSKWFKVNDLPTDFHLGNGGSWCRKNSKLNFSFETKKQSGKIIELRIIPKDKYIFDTCRPIGKHIREYYKNKRCVVCASSSDIVIDHKNDLYNDPRVLDINTQKPNDFQVLCNSCNLRKRAVSIKTRRKMKRYGATNIPMLKVFGVDFLSGDETLDINNPDCLVGTYWYDPIAFMNGIKEKIK